MKLPRFKPLDYASAVGFLAYSSVSAVTPICLLALAREMRLNLTSGGTLEVARSIPLLFILLASGFAAARWGKTRVLGISAVVMGLGMFLYAFAPGYGVVLLALGLTGLGSGMLEGLINPLIQEQHPDDSGRYLNLLNGFWSVGVLTTMLLVGGLLSRDVSWRLVVGCAGIPCLAAGAMFLILGRESRPRRRGSIRGAFGDLREIVRSGRFWVFMAAMFLGGGVEMGFTFWSASYIQLRFGASAAAGGFGAACFAGGMILGRFAFGHWVAQRHLKRLIILSALAGMVVGAVFPFVDRIWAVHATLLFCGIAVACFWPSIQSYSVDCLRMDPTMIFILLSCGGIPGCAAVSWSMGRIGDAKDLRTAFLLLPPLFLCLALLILTTKPRPAVAVDGLFDGSD